MIKSAICREQCDNYDVHKEVSFIFETASYPKSCLAYSSPLFIVDYLAKIFIFLRFVSQTFAYAKSIMKFSISLLSRQN